ncbi:mannitol-1-phosphate 5-dehydrogenase [Helcobacillus massiliensis]|uniref:mannitol-1-phosphate 5-dehydrogenase n=1 Tax=Helcobacillus massiliensis TaxID=521392 RepID=UPI0021A2C99E|nr:mannitol-1-phosphate 5-dehydrogenase [Helcobacillus massiliensis]MCT1557546.1 mannitol-1-phosphate 5-dehydrogenase [Helcobacillus massiliensis]MCT2036771.1 mannitol-1-phosphate 5-dehydrogenase [Helcobacillus massiliensis]MCT2332476.1 mannitol-1-phosphate 5-dehydrogenase [Helcobacillus massiliensis]
MKRTVHFGAGNIGRGFVGLLLHQAGYHVVFADVADALIDSLNEHPSYTVRTVGTGSGEFTVDGYSAVNSAKDPEKLTEEIAGAEIITTAVGAPILKIVAPAIAAGIAARPAGSPRVAVMACENAINATDILETEVRKNYAGDDLDERAFFANTAVDRIVPNQPEGSGLDVTVEVFHEWAVERGPFGGDVPDIPGITWVDDLEPYIERKLFTVNTGHACTAWYGWSEGYSVISDAIADRAVSAHVLSVLNETAALLVAKHGFAIETQQAYIEKILDRFANPHLEDSSERVGRSPMRKLSRHDRIIGPAAELAERGFDHGSLLDAFRAALRFTPDSGDAEVQQLQDLLNSGREAGDLVQEITGVEPGHPLFASLERIVAEEQDRRA